ncbi:MAG TPA: ArsA-related P-loop ATPase [Jatrophihabitantaceae bacterium]|nr:ArsA-related P-loop ATPase [Jatrophihabitantaceae bacterium]
MVAATSAPRSASVELAAGIDPQARLHIVTGKGGTGKTTVAAALALALASGGRKTLLVEVEGRQALAQLFDVAALPYAEHRLVTTSRGGQLWGLAIDAEDAMIEYLDMFYGLKRSARGLKRMGAVDFVTTLAPGLRDVLLTGKVKEAVTRTNSDGRLAYDVVVLDAPPTGRIRPFLDATREVANLTKFGPINRQSAGVIDLLHGPRTAVHLVTLLEEMPVQETLDAAHDLTNSGFHLGAVVVNRARPALIGAEHLGADGTVDTKAITAGLRKVHLSATYAKALAAEVGDYAQRQRIQAENLERLEAVDAPRIELPDLNPPVELGELHELAVHFTVPEAES